MMLLRINYFYILDTHLFEQEYFAVQTVYDGIPNFTEEILLQHETQIFGVNCKVFCESL